MDGLSCVFDSDRVWTLFPHLSLVSLEQIVHGHSFVPDHSGQTALALLCQWVSLIILALGLICLTLTDVCLLLWNLQGLCLLWHLVSYQWCCPERVDLVCGHACSWLQLANSRCPSGRCGVLAFI